MTAYKPLQLASVLRGTDIDFMALLRRLEEYDRNMRAMLDGGLNFPDNFEGKEITFTSSATPDAENTVVHALGRVPTRFYITSLDKAAIVYRSATAFTSSSIYLKANVASVAVKAIVY